MKEKLKELIGTVLEKNHIDFNLDEIVVEVPKENSHGDYATNVAMQLARTLKKNPREIATLLIADLHNDDIEKVEIAGPGFINFYMKT